MAMIVKLSVTYYMKNEDARDISDAELQRIEEYFASEYNRSRLLSRARDTVMEAERDENLNVKAVLVSVTEEL